MRLLPQHIVLLGLLTSCAEPNVGDAAADNGSAPVGIRADVIYGHKYGMALTLDVYQPRQPNGAGIVFMNSGGSVSPVVSFHTVESGRSRFLTDSEVEFADYAPGRLLESGFTLFNVRHGSAPRFVLPEIVEDMRLAIRFVRASAQSFGVDANRLGLWGGSAGGSLALLLGTTPEIPPSGDLDSGLESHAPVAAVVAYFSNTDLDTWIPHVDRWASEIVGLDLFTILPALDFPRDQNQQLSALHHVTAGDPPTLIIHGDQDILVPLSQGETMYAALREVGVPSELIVIEGAEHGFVDDEAELALAQTLSWFQRYLQ